MGFSKILTHWYSNHKRDLPWRQTKDPYYIWLSEIILQQTQVKQGLPYYESFINQFPTVFNLANSEESRVLKLWQGLGYYSRARNLHATAKYVAYELNGVFPDNYNDLLTLKGVGDYTASAIASICFDEVAPVVDGNVYRVLSRYFGISVPTNSSKGVKVFKQLAQEHIDKLNPATFNQAIMEFGATQCKSQTPNCNICPLQNGCWAFNKNEISQLPVKIKAKKPRKRYFNFMVLISKDKKTILEKRQSKGIWQNLYQFPLVETDHDINHQTFVSQIEEHVLLKDSPFELALYNSEPIIHKLSHQHIYAKFWIVNITNFLEEGIDVSEIHDYPVPILIGNFLDDFNF